MISGLSTYIPHWVYWRGDGLGPR